MLKDFKPTLWSARLIANLDKSLVFKNFVNTDYEGEIKAFGDSVVINQFGDITVLPYTGADIADPEDVTGSTQTLLIDQAQYYNFKVKDLDAAQANIDLVDKAMERAAVAIANVIDMSLAKLVTGAGATVGTLVAPTSITVSNAYDKLVDLGVKMTELNVPKAGRQIILPAWYIGLLSKDPRFTLNFTVLANGVVEGATVGGFTLMESNNVLKDVTDPSICQCPAGTKSAISYAGQVTEIEPYRPQSNFSDAVKGLFAYGHKVVQPAALINFIIKQGV